MTYVAPHNAEGEKLFPIQGDHDTIQRKRDGREVRGYGFVTWKEAEEAYAVYAGFYGRSQSLERLAERAGFGWDEIEDLLGHRATAEQPYSGIQG